MSKNVIQPQDKYVLRLPDGMRDHLKEAAAENGRSMNAEIIARLEDYEDLKEQAFELGKILGAGRALASLGADEKAGVLAMQMQENLALRKHVRDLEFDLNKARAERDSLLEDQENLSIPDDHTLYVLLDADGMPISWQEIFHHLGELRRAGGFNIDRIEARIFDAKHVGNRDREDEFFEIFQRYRKLRKQRTSTKPAAEDN
ncbi:Arc family DNA-binding protein [Terrihabitans sp. B22-R8]|uniref:Arc family DNA-binding protein n=1 Tax=Terrihabitans sp. B22-R8 TaxID=3425128 RepID=UPI00403D3FF7